MSRVGDLALKRRAAGTGPASRNYSGHAFMLADKVRINSQVARFPLSWQGRLKRALGAMKTWADLERWSEEVGRLTDAERGGLRPDASDGEICQQADVTARDFGRRIMQWRAIVEKGLRLESLRERFGRGFASIYVAGECVKLLDRRGMLDFWPAHKGETGRWADVARMACTRFWRRVYRRLHAGTVGAVEIGIGLVRKTAGLFCSDDQVRRSKAQDVRNAAVLESVVGVNDHLQAYTLAELAAKGVANQEIRRHELLTRIAGFELIAKDCGHVGVMVTTTCASRYHATTTRADGRVVDNPRYERLTPRDGQENLARKWARCRAAAVRIGLSWYGFRIAEPQQDGTPHWHILLFMPRVVESGCALTELQELFRKYFLDQDMPDEPGAQKHRVDFEVIDWAKGSAVGYVIKYISKNIDGHGVGTDLFGGDAVTNSQRVRGWAKQWRIRQFQQIGGAPVTVWRELRRVHPDNVPESAPAALREAVDAMNVKKPDAEQMELPGMEGGPSGQAQAWAKFNAAMGGVTTCRKAHRIRLIKEKTGLRTRYGEAAPDRTVGVWAQGVELFRNHIHEMDPKAFPFERPVTMQVESERAQWLMGGTSKAAALAVASKVFERSREAASTRIHVNNCTRPDPGRVSQFAPVVRRREKLRVFRRFDPSPGRPPGQFQPSEVSP